MAEIKLTPAQQAIIENRGSALLVSAAAGSGKTKVLVDRLLSMILDSENPHNVDEFMISTFTKAAATELREKIQKAIEERLSAEPFNKHLQLQLIRLQFAQISTVHGFCSAILKEYAGVIGLYPDFRMADDIETKILKQRAMDRTLTEAFAEYSEPFQAFANTIGNGRDDRNIRKYVQKVYDAAESHMQPLKWLDEAAGMYDAAEVDDFGSTIWGTLLMNEVKEQLSTFVGILQKLCPELETDPKLEKGYLPVIRSDIEMLERYSACATWDEIRNLGAANFDKLGQPRNVENKDLQEATKACRDIIKTRTNELLSLFEVDSEYCFSENRKIGMIVRGLVETCKHFSRVYKEEKERRHVLDYGDLEHETIRLLYTNNHISQYAMEIRERYHEIMVDEYQDTNEVQDAIFAAISKDSTNLFMVGDVKQSIYRFRLADPTIFIRKYKSYAAYDKAKPGEPRKIVLSNNFRSRDEILEAVNGIFRQSMTEKVGDLKYGDDEALYHGREFPEISATKVGFYCVSAEEDGASSKDLEAEFIADKISEMISEKWQITDGDKTRAVTAGDIAILLRAKEKVANFNDSLKKRGIKTFTPLKQDLYSTEEIRIVSSVFEVINNPHRDIPLAAALCSPIFEVTANEIALIRSSSAGDLYEAVKKSHLEKIDHFKKLISHLRDILNADGLAEMTEALYETAELEAVFGLMDNGEARINNLHKFKAVILQHAANGGDLSSFITHLEELRESDNKDNAIATTDNAVLINSIHSAKGLEYPVVIIPDMSKGINMKDFALDVLVHSEFGIVTNLVDMEERMKYVTCSKKAIEHRLKEEAKSEELRVLYVALTRPKDYLIMTYSEKSLKTTINRMKALLKYADEAFVSSTARSIGDWVLMHALKRIESGALDAYSELQLERKAYDYPWDIRVITGNDKLNHLLIPEQKQNPDNESEANVSDETVYEYPYKNAAEIPSRITATQLKGRMKDEEIRTSYRRSENMHTSQLLENSLSAAERGTAIHLALQYAKLENCKDIASAQEELEKLREMNYLSEVQAKNVKPDDLVKLYQSPVGEMMLHSDKTIREFKFSLLVPAKDYLNTDADEEVVLQGVADCCVFQNGKMTVIDFKSDYVETGKEAAAAEKYRVQLETYGKALAVIFDTTVENRIVYFIRSGKYVAL